MTLSKCCNAEVINWHGNMHFSFEEQKLKSVLICMKCGKPTEKKRGDLMNFNKSQKIFIYTLLKSELFCIQDDIATLDLRIIPYPEHSITRKAYEDAKEILIKKYNKVEEIIKLFEEEGEPK